MQNFWKLNMAEGQETCNGDCSEKGCTPARLLAIQPFCVALEPNGLHYAFFGAGYSTPKVSTVISLITSGVFGLSP